jgi:hypothetical protein
MTTLNTINKSPGTLTRILASWIYEIILHTLDGKRSVLKVEGAAIRVAGGEGSVLETESAAIRVAGGEGSVLKVESAAIRVAGGEGSVLKVEGAAIRVAGADEGRLVSNSSDGYCSLAKWCGNTG